MKKKNKKEKKELRFLIFLYVPSFPSSASKWLMLLGSMAWVCNKCTCKQLPQYHQFMLLVAWYNSLYPSNNLYKLQLMILILRIGGFQLSFWSYMLDVSTAVDSKHINTS